MPMKRRSLVLLVALLMTAAGAWAQEPGREATVKEEVRERMAEPEREPAQERSEKWMENWWEPLKGFGGLEPLPDSLPELIEIAMMNNPEVLQAKAELAQASANLHQVQLEVARKVTSLAAQRRELRGPYEQYTKAAFDHGGIADIEPERLEALAQLAAELRYVVGIGFPIPMEEPFLGERRERFERERMHRVFRPGFDTIPEEAAAALGSTFEMDYDEAKPLSELLQVLSDYVSVNLVAELDVGDIEFRVSMVDTSLRGLLTALTDQCEELAFVVRDYGILATTRERAMRIEAPAIPEDLPLLKAGEGEVPAGAKRPGSVGSEELAKQLQAPVSLAMDGTMPMRDVLEFFGDVVGANTICSEDVAEIEVSLRLDDVPFREALAALADAYEDVAFVVRDYGILATPRERAMHIDGPAIPTDLPLFPAVP